MRTIITLIILSIVLIVAYNLNLHYGWINLNFNWTDIAIGIAASGGPLQYLKQKMDEKIKDKESVEKEMNYRTINYNEFVEREKRIQNKNYSIDEKQPVVIDQQQNTEFSKNGSTYG